jgi:hypothetical protein
MRAVVLQKNWRKNLINNLPIPTIDKEIYTIDKEIYGLAKKDNFRSITAKNAIRNDFFQTL